MNTYTYDSANHLTALSGSSGVTQFTYNGLGDRLRQMVNGNTTTFTMDLNSGLTQVLSDGTNTYLYGNGRIAQVNTATDYFLPDALGSVRQLTNGTGAVTYARAYDPYGVVTATSGASTTPYGYTGEYTTNDLVYLRARHYDPAMGRFLTRDTWMGDYNRPLSLNRWMYVEENPINLTDPSGRCGEPGESPCPDWWENESHLYVEGYGYFDAGHLSRGWISVEYIQSEFENVLEKGGKIYLSSSDGLPPEEIYWADYYVFVNVKALDEAQKTGVMYGIYTDFEPGYENYQFWNRLSRLPSGFSPEDLPSDHLGFWASIHGLKEDDIPFLLECLGEVTDRGSDQFGSLVIDYSSGPYGSASWIPRNFKFQSMVTEQYSYSNGVSGSISRNISWPTWLQIRPVPSGPNTWWKVREGHKVLL